MNKKTSRRIIFWILVSIVILPITFLTFESIFYHEIYNTPAVENGVLNLSGFDLERNDEMPLDGTWEFYWDKLLVTENHQNAVPDAMLKVPGTWSLNGADSQSLQTRGKASYRILVRSGENDLSATCYIPHICERYRMYIDGNLISSSLVDGDVFATDQQPKLFSLSPGSSHELVVELDCTDIGGMYRVPFLEEANASAIRRGLYRLTASIYIGVIISTICSITFVTMARDKNFLSVGLLVMDVLMLLRILSKDEFYQVLYVIFPVGHDFMVLTITQCITLFLPCVFLFCIRQLVRLPITARAIINTAIYCSICSALLLHFGAAGNPLAQQIVSMVSYLPFISIFRNLYHGIQRGSGNLLLVTAILSTTLSSMIVGNLNISGLLIVGFSLVGPTLFVISAMLQNTLYILRNSQVRARLVEAENLRLKIHESERTLMLSQLAPHFLYNALITIQVLCREDPSTAAEAVERFAKYLRVNMRSLDFRDLISFSQELEHIKNYVAIEKLRFQERLDVEYEIEVSDFLIPPLTIQPLVENAVKHGACRNICGGIVLLRTFETKSAYVIIVKDNGPGFDPLSDAAGDKAHGLHNITFCLKQWINAAVDIDSRANSNDGTTVTVTIPKEVHT